MVIALLALALRRAVVPEAGRVPEEVTRVGTDAGSAQEQDGDASTGGPQIAVTGIRASSARDPRAAADGLDPRGMTEGAVVLRVQAPPRPLESYPGLVVVEIDPGERPTLRMQLGSQDPPQSLSHAGLSGTSAISRRNPSDGTWSVNVRGLSPGPHTVVARETFGNQVRAIAAPVEWTKGESPEELSVSFPSRKQLAHLAIEVLRGDRPYEGGHFRVSSGRLCLANLDFMPPERSAVIDIPAKLELRVECVRWPGWRVVPGPSPVQVRAAPGETATAHFVLGPVVDVRIRNPPYGPISSIHGLSLWWFDAGGRAVPCSDFVDALWLYHTGSVLLPPGTYFARHQEGRTLGGEWTARFTVGAASPHHVQVECKCDRPVEGIAWTFEDESGAPVQGQLRVWLPGATRVEDLVSWSADLIDAKSPPVRLPDGDYFVFVGGRGCRRTLVSGGVPREQTIRCPPLPRRPYDGAVPTQAARGSAGSIVGHVALPPSIDPTWVHVIAEAEGTRWGRSAASTSQGTFEITDLAPGTYRLWVVPHEWTPDIGPGPHAAVDLPEDREVRVILRP